MLKEFLEKITAYPNEAIHDDCVVAFTGGYIYKYSKLNVSSLK